MPESRAATNFAKPRSPKSPGLFLSSLLILSCIFPYVSPVPSPFDTQPYSLVFAVAIIVVGFQGKSLNKAPTWLYVPGIVAAISILSWLVTGLTFPGLRSVAGYFTVVFVGVAAYISSSIVRYKMLAWTAGIWLSVGLAQRIVSRTLFTQIVARSSTTESRGVTALAVEPSFYAIILIFLLLLNDYALSTNRISRRRYILTAALILPQFVLASSALGLLLLGCYLLAKALVAGGMRTFLMRTGAIVAVASATLWLYLSVDSLQQSRVAVLAHKASISASSLLTEDGSIATRAFSAQVSIESIRYSWGLGYGVGTWRTGVQEVLASSGDRYDFYGISAVASDRVMSGIGGPIYELGIIGLLVQISFVGVCLRAYRAAPRGDPLKLWSILVLITVSVIMLGATPLAFPLYGYIFGLVSKVAGNMEDSQAANADVTVPQLTTSNLKPMSA